MKLPKLADSYSNLSAVEIVKKIADGSIADMWMRKYHISKARTLVNDEVSEEDAINFLDKVDNDRNEDFYFDKQFD